MSSYFFSHLPGSVLHRTFKFLAAENDSLLGPSSGLFPNCRQSAQQYRHRSSRSRKLGRCLPFRFFYHAAQQALCYSSAAWSCSASILTRNLNWVMLPGLDVLASRSSDSPKLALGSHSAELEVARQVPRLCAHDFPTGTCLSHRTCSHVHPPNFRL